MTAAERADRTEAADALCMRAYDAAGGPDAGVALVPKIRIEIVVGDDDADDIVGIVVKTAQTGRIGDGKVWVSPIETVVRVRTGDKDEAAL